MVIDSFVSSFELFFIGFDHRAALIGFKSSHQCSTLEIMSQEGSPLGGGEMRAVVSKRGVDDGNLKGGGFLQPAKENHLHYTKNKKNVKRKF